MASDHQHPNYKKAKALAFERSKGVCQFCGLKKAEEAHHWHGYQDLTGYKNICYKPVEKIKGEDLTALCKDCHRIASAIKARHKKIVIEKEQLRRKEQKLNEKKEELTMREKNLEEEIEARAEEKAEAYKDELFEALY